MKARVRINADPLSKFHMDEDELRLELVKHNMPCVKPVSKANHGSIGTSKWYGVFGQRGSRDSVMPVGRSRLLLNVEATMVRYPI